MSFSFPVANAGVNGGSLVACAGMSGGGISVGGISGGGMSGGGHMSGGGMISGCFVVRVADSSVERECLVVLISRSRPLALEGC